MYVEFVQNVGKRARTHTRAVSMGDERLRQAGLSHSMCRRRIWFSLISSHTFFFFAAICLSCKEDIIVQNKIVRKRESFFDDNHKGSKSMCFSVA